MKIIITENQAKKLSGKTIKCEKCDHSWEKEPNDKHFNLCHMCGWDNGEKKYNDKELLNFWKKQSTINEVVSPDVNFNSGKEVARYLMKRIPYLKYMNHFFDEEINEDRVSVDFQNVTYNQDVEMSKPTDDGIFKLEFKQFNTIVELRYYKSLMGGPRNEPKRFRYSIRYDFGLAMMFKDKPEKTQQDELFQHVFQMATKQALENKFSYSNEVFTEDENPPKDFLDESINEINKRFLMTEEYIENLPSEVENPFSGYSDKEITEALVRYFGKSKKRNIS